MRLALIGELNGVQVTSGHASIWSRALRADLFSHQVELPRTDPDSLVHTAHFLHVFVCNASTGNGSDSTGAL